MTKQQLTGYFRATDKTSEIIGSRQAAVFMMFRTLAGHEQPGEAAMAKPASAKPKQPKSKPAAAKPTKAAKALLKKGRKLKATAKIVFKPASGKASSVSKSLTFKAAKKAKKKAKKR